MRADRERFYQCWLSRPDLVTPCKRLDWVKTWFGGVSIFATDPVTIRLPAWKVGVEPAGRAMLSYTEHLDVTDPMPGIVVVVRECLCTPQGVVLQKFPRIDHIYSLDNGELLEVREHEE